MKKYQENRELIRAYIKGETYEGLDGDGNAALGMGVGIFLVFLIGSLAIYIWAIVALVKNWKKMPQWAQIVGVLCLILPIPGSIIVTLILAYVARK